MSAAWDEMVERAGEALYAEAPNATVADRQAEVALTAAGITPAIADLLAELENIEGLRMNSPGPWPKDNGVTRELHLYEMANALVELNRRDAAGAGQ